MRLFHSRLGSTAILLASIVTGSLPVYAQATSGAYTISIFRPSWNTDGSPGLAVWVVDSNGSHAWEPSDAAYYFGIGGDVPVMGDWTFTGQRRLGIFRPQGGAGAWYVDMDDSRSWTSADTYYFFGLPGDLPLTLNWIDGYLHMAVYRPSESAVYLDTSHCNCSSSATNRYPVYGTQPGDLPVMINFADGQGGRLAFYRPGTATWYVLPALTSSTTSFDLTSVTPYPYGTSGDVPVAGDWTGTGSGIWNIGAYRGSGLWYVDATAIMSWTRPIPSSTLSAGPRQRPLRARRHSSHGSVGSAVIRHRCIRQDRHRHRRNMEECLRH